MPGLKKYFPDVRMGGNKVTPDEIDRYENYYVVHPSVSDTFYGTVSTAVTTGAAIVFTNVRADYPRNILFTMLGVAGGMGGTAVVNGKDQFGVTIQETVSFGSAAGGGTVAGTKVFSQLTSGSVTGVVGLGGTAVGTAKLGVASGTASGIANLFGLPVRVQAVGDVKTLTWVNNGTVTAVNGGTITSSHVGTANHTFMGTSVVAITDSYYVRTLTTFNSENKTNLA